ncbi:3-oxoadipate enol-lactonase 2 [bacterium HR19]|nr:3-oxoadipate enol-lactonase 2 [bacterium HR19]
MGEKLVIYFFHAFPLNSNMWKEQIRYFSPKVRCVAINFPGFGGASDDSIPQNPSLSDYAKFAEDIILNTSEGVKICIVGLSMGGYIAMEVIKRKVVRPDFLVLANTKSSPDTQGARQRRFKLIEEIDKLKSVEPVISFYLPNLVPPESFLKEKVLEMAKTASLSGLKKALFAMAERQDYQKYIDDFPGRLLCIGGEKDVLSPPDVVKSMARDKEKEFRLIKGVGHLSNMENPEEFNNILEEFLFS